MGDSSVQEDSWSKSCLEEDPLILEKGVPAAPDAGPASSAAAQRARGLRPAGCLWIRHQAV